VRNAAVTRQAMLVAARRRFLEESYENVGLRDIAGEVGVDVALVNRYFGSKEELFKEVLREGKAEKFDLPGMAGDLPAYLADLATDVDGEEDHVHLARLLIILRSASSPQAAEIVRSTVQDDMLRPFARLLGGGDAERRASLAMALMMGTTIMRSILCVGARADGDREAIRERLKGMFEAALAEG
jgi:AcrR family transcriptional regulator